MKKYEKFSRKRFNSILAIKNYLENVCLMNNVEIVRSENETDESFDFVLDCESDCSIFTLFFLFDNKGMIYITEVS